MRALFGRKVATLDELKELTERAVGEGMTGRTYTVDEEVVLSDKDFKGFAADLLADQQWINPRANCIRVINEDTKETVLIDPQGYRYPRYTSLEIKD